jgi:hypothetical protein
MVSETIQEEDISLGKTGSCEKERRMLNLLIYYSIIHCIPWEFRCSNYIVWLYFKKNLLKVILNH